MAKMNPHETVDTVLTATGAIGMLLNVFGAPRAGGALFAAGGTYALLKGDRTGQKIVGGVYEVVGLGIFFYPEIKSALASTSKPLPPKDPNFNQNVPVYNVSLRQGTFDEDIGNGWALIDARESRVRAINPDTDVHVGNTVSLILRYKNGPEKVFNAHVINITGDDFSGQWAGGGPSGGPQLIDFRGAHIFEYH